MKLRVLLACLDNFMFIYMYSLLLFFYFDTIAIEYITTNLVFSQ